jgi:hypothetical protein
MKNHYLIKVLSIAVIFLIMQMSFHSISSERIEYPKEEGPYNVIIRGTCLGMAGSFYTLLIHFPPLWLLFYPMHIEWDFEENSTFHINNEKQDIQFPAQIRLSGFKGYGTSIHMIMLKIRILILMGYTPGLLSMPKAHVVGQCSMIIVHDSK